MIKFPRRVGNNDNKNLRFLTSARRIASISRRYITFVVKIKIRYRSGIYWSDPTRAYYWATTRRSASTRILSYCDVQVKLHRRGRFSDFPTLHYIIVFTSDNRKTTLQPDIFQYNYYSYLSRIKINCIAINNRNFRFSLIISNDIILSYTYHPYDLMLSRV